MVASRRTQAERRESTRATILDATVEALTDLGLARTTTSEIAARAGTSQGSIFRYWATKGELLADAAGHVFDRLRHEYGEQLSARLVDDAARGDDGRDDPVATAIELLWSTFQQPDLTAVLELYTAARTDDDLATALREIQPQHRRNLHALAAALLPDLAPLPFFADVVDVVIAAVQGATTSLAASPRPDVDRERTIRTLTACARAMVDAGS